MRKNPTRRRSLLILALLALIPAPARADMLGVDSLGTLATNSASVVLLQRKQDRWIVAKELSGHNFKAGDEFTAGRMDMYTLDHFFAKPPLADDQMASALAFVEISKNEYGKEIRSVIFSGLRVGMADGRVVRPVAPGGDAYVLMSIHGARWDDTVATVTKLLADAAEARKLRDISDPAERNRAIEKWLADHANELRGTTLTGFQMIDQMEPTDERPPAPIDPAFAQRRDWGMVPYELASAVIQTNRRADIWETVRLWNAVGGDLFPGVSVCAAFQTSDAQAFLLAIAADPKAAIVDRRLALRMNEEWSTNGLNRHEPADLVRQEQQSLLAAVIPLLTDPDQDIRDRAVTIIFRLGTSYDIHGAAINSDLALDPLARRYLAEDPGDMRNALATYLASHESTESWQKLSGNPRGMAPVISSLQTASANRGGGFGAGVPLPPGFLYLHVNLCDPEKPAFLFAIPTAIAQRIEAGKIVETLHLPLLFDRELFWNTGIIASALDFKLDTTPLAPGTWQLRITGTLDDPPDAPKTPHWKSEPALFQVAPPAPPAR